jgi:hypothetical protein
MTERVLNMLVDELRNRDLPDYDTYDPYKRDFVVSTYRDLEQFVSTNGDEILEQLIALRERAEDAHSDTPTLKPNLNEQVLHRFLELLPGRAFFEICKSVGIDATIANAKRLVAYHVAFYGGPMFDRIEQAFSAASGHEALLKALDERIAEYVNQGWSFDAHMSGPSRSTRAI